MLLRAAVMTGCAAVCTLCLRRLISSSARKAPAIVHVGNLANFQQKLRKLIKGGASELQVITDYDKTLTTYGSHTSWDMLERSGILSPSYEQATRELADKYHPIEIDPHLSVEAKTTVMVEWWDAAHKLLVAEKLHRDVLMSKTAQLQSKVMLRTNFQAFFELLHTHNVPVLILSAGIGEMIEFALAAKGLAKYNHDNVHILSNFFSYDDAGLVVGFKGKMIHVYNKSEAVIKETPHHANIAARGNVLLMGDSLGDLQMADGVDHECVLSIGFLHTSGVDPLKAELMLKTYKEKFDMVLLNTDSLEVVNELLEQICGGGGEGGEKKNAK